MTAKNKKPGLKVKPKIGLRSDAVAKVIASAAAPETTRLNLEIPVTLKADFNLAAMKNGSKMTPLIVKFMQSYVDNNN